MGEGSCRISPTGPGQGQTTTYQNVTIPHPTYRSFRSYITVHILHRQAQALTLTEDATATVPFKGKTKAIYSAYQVEVAVRESLPKPFWPFSTTLTAHDIRPQSILRQSLLDLA